MQRQIMYNKFDATLCGVKLCIDIGLLHPAASRQHSVIRSPVLRSARNTPSSLTSFVHRAGLPSHISPPRVRRNAPPPGIIHVASGTFPFSVPRSPFLR